MPKVDVYDITGKKVNSVELNENVFGIEPNENIVHSVLVNYLANQRQGTQSTKTRAEVRGGGRKPWRQKGTGRARQGSIRAPQWIKGGIALGPKPRSYKYRVNKKEKRLQTETSKDKKRFLTVCKHYFTQFYNKSIDRNSGFFYILLVKEKEVKPPSTFDYDAVVKIVVCIAVGAAVIAMGYLLLFNKLTPALGSEIAGCVVIALLWFFWTRINRMS